MFDRVDNLQIDGEVHFKGVTVGKLVYMELFGDSVLADIKLIDTLKIRVGSKFIITSGIFGYSHITIEPSDKKIFLTEKDTVRGSYMQKGILDDMVSDSTKRDKIQQALYKIVDVLEELAEASKDTISQSK